MPNTNSWLCIYAIAQLGRPYKMGSSGEAIESTQAKLKQKDWESSSTAYDNPNKGKVVKTHDCSGLFVGALSCEDVNGPKILSTPLYHGATKQYWDFCKHQRGDSISTFPRIPGMLVFRSKGSTTKEHVGVYIGKFIDLNGNPHEDYVIDAKGRDWGVIMGPLFKKDGSSRWDCWGQLDLCEQDTSPDSVFDARTNSMIHEAPEDTTGDIQPVTIATENMKPFVATVLGQYNPKLNYDKIKEARISAMMLYGGELFDVSHTKHTYINPALLNQVAQCNAAGLPYALYVNVRARNEIEADAECKALYYVISQCPPKLGLWLSLQMNNSRELNDKIIEIYYKFIYRWGLTDKCGLYVTPKQLETITWENFQDAFYLWYISPEDVNNVDDELLNPDLFDIDPENSTPSPVENHDIIQRDETSTTFELGHSIEATQKGHDWLPNIPKRDEGGRFVTNRFRTQLAQHQLEERGLAPLYNTQTDRHDMTLRQVGYLNTNYSLSNDVSNIAISVINYTSVLGDLYTQFAPAVATINSVKVDTSQLDSNTKICIDYIVDQGYSAASACGITACLNLYSRLDTGYVGQVGTKYVYGIGAWDEIHMNEMKDMVGLDWKTNLTGQLEYLMYDIETNYSAMVLGLRLQQLDKENAETVAEVFLTVYNELFVSNNNIEKVKSYAGDIYDKLIITGIKNQSPSVIGEAHAEVFNINGQILSPQYTVAVPPELDQAGIADYFTAYYRKWKSGTVQEQLFEIWKEQGKPNDKGIAMIGGCYCVAVKTEKFGSLGDIIAVALKNEVVFPAIIADAKGVDAKNEWGHDYSNGVSIIEWERVKTTPNGTAIKGKDGSDVDHPHDVSWMKTTWEGWYMEDVAYVTNYGSYLA